MKVFLITFIVALLVMLVLPANSDFFALTNNYQPLVSLFLEYIRGVTLPGDVRLFTSTFSDPITLYVYAAIVFAVIISLPVFAYEVFKFVEPALYSNEKKMVYPFVSSVMVLFIAGALVGFYFLAPSFISSMLAFYPTVGAELLVPIMDFYSLLLFTLLISGLIFTLPAFFVLLIKFGIIRTNIFTKSRKYVYAGLVILSLLISPGATPQGDLYLFIILAILFEVSILVGKYFERGVPLAKPPAIMGLFSEPMHKCAFCQVETRDNFCPHCKRALV
jgi:Sec-independent protein secretion pathway component TatC